jgi:hypothetical protein
MTQTAVESQTVEKPVVAIPVEPAVIAVPTSSETEPLPPIPQVLPPAPLQPRKLENSGMPKRVLSMSLK